MFTKKYVITEELKAIFEHTKDMERGTLIPYEDIELVTRINGHTGMTREHPAWGTFVSRWKRSLRPLGKWIRASNPPGVGYRILTIDEHFGEYERRQKSAHRQANEGALCVGILGEDELSEEQRRLQIGLTIQSAEIHKAFDKHRAQRRSWLSNPQTLPRIESK